MVVVAGYNPFNGKLCLFDTITKKEHQFNIMKLNLDIGDEINDVLLHIVTQSNQLISLLCVVMDYRFKNNLRQKFIAAAKKWKIKEVRIISVQKAKLLGALNAIENKLKRPTLCWIINVGRNDIQCSVWNYCFQNGWILEEVFSQNKTYQSLNEPPTESDLINLKSKLKNFIFPPFIAVYSIITVVDKEVFKNVFCHYSEFKFISSIDWINVAVLYAKYHIKNIDLSIFKSVPVFENYVVITSNNLNILKIPMYQALPFSKTITLKGNSNKIVKIFADQVTEIEKQLEWGKMWEITIDIDRNGCYTLSANQIKEKDISEDDLSLSNTSHDLSRSNDSLTVEISNLWRETSTVSESPQQSTLTKRKERITDKNVANTKIPPRGENLYVEPRSPPTQKPLQKKPQQQQKENETLNTFLLPIKSQSYQAEVNAIGIDMGTTQCCAAVIRKNGPDFVALDPVTALRTLPSYIAFDEKQPKCGQIVIDRLRQKAEHSVFDIKLIIGKKFDDIIIDPLWPFNVVEGKDSVLIEVETCESEKSKILEEVTGVLIKYIKKTVEAYQDTILSEVVITIPSEFSEKQKQATQTAAEIAGWKIVHFIPEPVAAAFVYFSDINIPKKSNILICDCGGGTFDICVAKIMEQKLEILNCDGDSYLGGRDFDRLLFVHFDTILKYKHQIDVTKSNKKYVLKQKCQDVKHTLSVTDEAWARKMESANKALEMTTSQIFRIDISDFHSEIDGIVKITRKEFEALAADLLVRAKNVLIKAISKSTLNRNDIKYVFQVGGGCRMPMIKELLLDIFPTANHQCNINPDLVVAQGAALYAYQLKSKGYEASSGLQKPFGDSGNKNSSQNLNNEKVSFFKKIFGKK